MRIPGPVKFAAYKDGTFQLSDLVGETTNSRWGAMRYEKSLKEVLGEEKAKEYTRLALLGVARNAPGYSADDLIRVVGVGLRELTPQELNKVIEHVANIGFNPNALEKCGSRIGGLVWNGQVLKSTDKLPTGVVHYLRHVVAQSEWSQGTLLDDYYKSLKNIILDKETKIVISRYGKFWQIGFLGQDGTWIDYRVKYGYWSTGFRPGNFETMFNSLQRSEIKWLR